MWSTGDFKVSETILFDTVMVLDDICICQKNIELYNKVMDFS